VQQTTVLFDYSCYFNLSLFQKIKTSAIKGVYYVEQNLSEQLFKVKGWGMSLSPCWWGCDLRRCWHSSSGPVHYNVIIDCGETFYKGFTVVDILDFLRELKSLAPKAIFANEFPF
ncbi:unnamed protein product, partial [Strongylus vulgaris]